MRRIISIRILGIAGLALGLEVVGTLSLLPGVTSKDHPIVPSKQFVHCAFCL